MARKLIEKTGEEVVETRTSRRDPSIPPGEIQVVIRDHLGHERTDQMTLEEYRELRPRLTE